MAPVGFNDKMGILSRFKPGPKGNNQMRIMH
jgi:hypothetical protein